MKRFTARIVGAVLLALPLALFAQPKQIQVVSENGPGTIPISDFGGVEMIPVRGVASFVGATVRDASERGAVQISGNGTLARVSDDRTFVSVGGELVLLQKPAKLVGDEWFVPLDFITKVLPSLSSDTITYRGGERMLVLGSSYPEIRISARGDNPTYTQVRIRSDRAVKHAVHGRRRGGARAHRNPVLANELRRVRRPR